MSFLLRRDQGYFSAGIVKSGRQAIIANTVTEVFVLFFDQEGNYLGAERVPLENPPKRDPATGIYVTDALFDRTVERQTRGIMDRLEFLPSDISVEAFSEEQLCAGIETLPGQYQEFLESPDDLGYDQEDREAIAVAIEEWKQSGCYCLVLWGIEYWVSASGEVISSGS